MARGRTEFTKIRGSIFVTVFARNLTYCQRERAARVCTGRTRKNFLPTRLAASFRANMDFPTFYFPRLLPGRYPLSNQPQRLVETIYFTTQTFREFFSNFVSLIERAGSASYLRYITFTRHHCAETLGTCSSRRKKQPFASVPNPSTGKEHRFPARILHAGFIVSIFMTADFITKWSAEGLTTGGKFWMFLWGQRGSKSGVIKI